MVKRIIQDIKFTKHKREVFSNEKVVISGESIIKENRKEEDIKPKFELNQNRQEQKIQLEPNTENYFNRQRLQNTPQVKGKKKIINKYTLFIFFISIIFGIIYWGGNIFQKTDIVINAKHEIIDYDKKSFLASKNKLGGEIDFEIMINSDKRKRSIVLTEPKDVSEKASGSIILYNEFSTSPIKLASGTFISDVGGKTYKTNKAVSIPGYKLDSNKKIIPGTVEVGIISFLAGEVYNGSPSEFHITSYKGTSKFNKVYGKLKSPLVGGISGLVYTLNEEDKIKLDIIAKSSLKDDLYKKVKALVPPGYILYPDAVTFSYKINEEIFSETPETEVEIDGLLSVVLLKEKSLFDNIIRISLPKVKGDELKEVTLPDLDKLVFSFNDPEQTIIKEIETISFSLTGDIDATWTPNVELLKNKLMGIHKNNAPTIFKEDPGITSAIVDIFPPWKKYITNDISKINISIK
jgi:hypothetical protein